MKTELTVAQKKSLELLKKRWHRVDEPTPEIGWPDTVLVWVHYKSGGKMLIGIEPDGYAHS